MKSHLTFNKIPTCDPYSVAEQTVAQQTPEQALASVIAERGKVYGDPRLSHENIGLSWTGIIQQHYGMKLPHVMPDYLVELLMVAFKTHRAARVYHADNYVDLAAYAKFAEADQKLAQAQKDIE